MYCFIIAILMIYILMLFPNYNTLRVQIIIIILIIIQIIIEVIKIIKINKQKI